jgi:hypothetical protein
MVRYGYLSNTPYNFWGSVKYFNPKLALSVAVGVGDSLP